MPKTQLEKELPPFIKEGIIRFNQNLLRGIEGLLDEGVITGATTVDELCVLLKERSK